MHQVLLAAGRLVCLGCLASDSDSNLSHNTDDHNIDTDSSLESFISLGNLYKLTPLA